MKLVHEPRPDDVLFASYPGSGNTWLRRMLTHVLLGLSGAPLKVRLDPEAYLDVVPSLEKEPGTPPVAIAPSLRRVVKTHALLSGFANEAIYLLRRPEDCLVAYFHFREARNMPVGDIDGFCGKEAEVWRRHVADALACARSRAVCLLAYEAIEADAQGALGRACAFLGWQAPPGLVAEAVEGARFDRLKERVPSERWVKHNLRGGRGGAGARELGAATLARLRETLDPLYEKAAAGAR